MITPKAISDICGFDIATYLDVKTLVRLFLKMPQYIVVQEFIDNHEWVPIHSLPGYECCIEYYVNRQGLVKSTKRNRDQILKPKVKRNRYKTVNLTQRIGRKKAISAYVHSLVALAFLPPPMTPIGRTKGCSMVAFKDGDSSNCSFDNLVWVKVSDSRRQVREELTALVPH
tara:strand:- start:92 stop:604 length:513 start_codon:yes stop_codon:yes gene_type:complete